MTNEQKLELNEHIKMTAYRLIQAMLNEADAMPRAYQAPNTVNAAGVLREALVQSGFYFEENSNG